MTNTLVGDVYAKIIDDVCTASVNDFEESGVSAQTLQEMKQEWQAKLSLRGVAHMPWDPKPQPVQQPAATQASSLPSATTNGLPPPSYPSNPYAEPQTATNGVRIKPEPGSEQQIHGLPTAAYGQNGNIAANQQGGAARAQHLIQQQYGAQANASLSAMQQQRGGLALPGQQSKPHSIQLPQGNAQQQFQQQQAAVMQQRQQQQLQQQQAQPRIKVENDSPHLQQGGFDQRQPNYSQTDGADEDSDLAQWRAMLAERRAVTAEQARETDRLMHDHVMRLSESLQSGLMVPLSEQPSRKNKKRKARSTQTATATASSSAALPSIPQLDGDADEDEEKPDIKDEDDENAINSDLDDSDDDGQGAMGDDDDDMGDAILCTYDKVQRVKNKWKCTLKDGVMSVNGKEWVFHKGMGEFEW